MADALTLYLMSKLSTYPVVPVAVTASTSCITGNLYVVSISTAAVVMTLPTPANGACIGVSTRAITTGSVTVTASSGVTFGPGMTSAGVTSFPLSTQGAEVLLLADGTNWNVIAGAQDSGWIAVLGGVGFQNSWVNFSNGYSSAAYRLTGNVVRITGNVKSGASGSVIFTLPSGFRPTVGYTQIASAVFTTAVSYGYITVGAAGAGTVVGNYTGSLSTLSFEYSFTVD